MIKINYPSHVLTGTEVLEILNIEYYDLWDLEANGLNRCNYFSDANEPMYLTANLIKVLEELND